MMWMIKIVPMPSFAGVTLLLFVNAILLTRGEPDHYNHRQTEKLFGRSTYLLNRTVSCDNTNTTDVGYPAETWSCYDIKIDGLRVRYWYMPGFGAEAACSDGEHVYDSRNDLVALCQEMLKAHGYLEDIWTVFVNDASCDISPNQRVIFTKKDGLLRWETYKAGRGYLRTLRCMGNK